VVSGDSKVGSRASNKTPAVTGSAQNSGDKGKVSRCSKSQFDCMDVISRHFQKKGFSKKSADLAARGRRKSTLRIYASRVRPFLSWCRTRKVNPYRASVARVADFLRSRFELGLVVSTVRGYLSAILAIHLGCEDGSSIRNDRSLHFLLEGMANSRPIIRKIWPAWDLPTVLEKLNESPYEPMQAASLKNVTLKTIFLIAVASGRRCSEIHALAIGSCIVFSQKGVTLYFKPGFLAKNKTSRFEASPLFLPYISKSENRSKRLSGPVRAIKWYVDRTSTVRGDIQQFFITSVKPYRPAAKATMARWLVEVINSTGALQSTINPRAHSVRAMSTS